MHVAAKSHYNFIRQTAAPGRKTKQTNKQTIKKTPVGFVVICEMSLCHSVAVIATYTIKEQDVASKAPTL